MNKKLIFGFAVFGALGVIAILGNDSALIKNYLHSNAFIMGHETMEVMANCPFGSDEMCERFEAECINRIEQGVHIDDDSLAECANSVEEATQEVCGAMGGDCELLQ